MGLAAWECFMNHMWICSKDDFCDQICTCFYIRLINEAHGIFNNEFTDIALFLTAELFKKCGNPGLVSSRMSLMFFVCLIFFLLSFAAHCDKRSNFLRCICKDGYAGHYCERFVFNHKWHDIYTVLIWIFVLYHLMTFSLSHHQDVLQVIMAIPWRWAILAKSVIVMATQTRTLSSMNAIIWRASAWNAGLTPLVTTVKDVLQVSMVMPSVLRTVGVGASNGKIYWPCEKLSGNM